MAWELQFLCRGAARIMPKTASIATIGLKIFEKWVFSTNLRRASPSESSLGAEIPAEQQNQPMQVLNTQWLSYCRHPRLAGKPNPEGQGGIARDPS